MGARRIIYASQATSDLSSGDLVRLLETSRRNNLRAGLCGMLLYSNQSFLQVLEGEDAALRSTYARIVGDGRHENLRLLMDDAVDSSLFPDWSMGFDHLEDDELDAQLVGSGAITGFPLVNPDLVTDAGVAQVLLTAHAKNRVLQAW